MTFNFAANWLFVFKPDGNDWFIRGGKFLVVTFFSAFVLQNAVLHLTARRWTWPVAIALAGSRKLNLDRRLGVDAISRNTCKALAVGVGLIWNFTWYKFFVYAP